jgi:hypothetical protein
MKRAQIFLGFRQQVASRRASRLRINRKAEGALVLLAGLSLISFRASVGSVHALTQSECTKPDHKRNGIHSIALHQILSKIVPQLSGD